ncbi:hypothetical protein AAGS39_47940 [Flavobacterium sp. CGRL2]
MILSAKHMKKESFEAAKDQILNYLLDNPIGAFTSADLISIFHRNRDDWKIANYRTPKHFIDFLEKSKILELIKLKHLTKGSIKQIFITPGANKSQIAQTIKKDGYLSFYSAAQIHQLTLQNPKSVYISYDKSGWQENDNELLQEDVDSAFSKPQRQSSEIYKSEIDDTRYYLIQKKTGSLHVGIINKNGVRYSDLERTLIDITIRPAYSGGVFEVLEAFINSKNKVNLEIVLQYLDHLDYVYPYHQLIGFYLDRAGYSIEDTNLFLERKTDIKFYLTYNISNKKFDEKWNLYYPNGF